MSGKELKAVTLFAGIGGTSLGLKLAGFKEILAIDWLKSLKISWQLNFPDINFWLVDIVSIKGRDILEKIKIESGSLDLLAASPPCQGFSISGKFEVSDERNYLFYKSIEILDEIAPKTFVFENVCGIMKGRMKGIFKDLLKRMSKNYKVKVKRMNSMFYDCATSRPRIIWVGVRKDILGFPNFPNPFSKILTVNEVIGGIEPITYKMISSNFRKIWERTRIGYNFSSAIGGEKYFSYRKVNPFLPCPTIQSSPFKLTHWNESRSLSVEELKRIASFPDDFKIVGSPSAQWNAIGNAVMPNFAKAIFLEVSKFLEEKK